MPVEERFTQVAIEDEMRLSYMDYAMSVIVGRALPDVRDGLKPVHRRILYGMNQMGLAHNRAYRKSAKIVGEIMGNYHPHGDSAIYDTQVRMAQDFNMRYTLVDGQGNYGSVDGDPPAAMRYTEARLTRLAGEMLADIDRETVDFGPTYDESDVEPLVLPAKAPNLLINGAGGIAVGYATNIPTHNLGEVLAALIHLLENPDASIADLMNMVPGPDFPTAGFIYGTQGIRDAYEHGRGLLTIRAKTHVETDEKRDRSSIIVTEIPYQVNKAKLLEKIAELVQEKRVEGISDIRDESDRDGIRVVIELKKGELPPVILNQLYKHTQLQNTFGVIMLALVNNRPEILNLKRILVAFLDHRREVVIRRTAYELRKAQERAHILEGLIVALSHLDDVIALIRGAASPDEARMGLTQQFPLSEIQAQAILDMRLQRLTQLEQRKLSEEYEELKARIASLQAILGSEDLVKQVIKDELVELKAAYQDERRTQIIPQEAEINIEDLIADEPMAVSISREGYIKRHPVSEYRAQRRGGKGKIGMGVKEEDFVEKIFTASTHDYILFFSDAGKVYWLKLHELPEAGRTSKGKAMVNLLALGPDERVTTTLPVREFPDDLYVVMATRMGYIKKTKLSAFGNPRQGGIIALTLEEGDKLIGVEITNGRSDIMLGTREGLVIRFGERDVRPVGRTARGVRGIRLDDTNHVIGMVIIQPEVEASILTVTEKGFGKRTVATEYRTQGRAGRGLISIKVNERNGSAVSFHQVKETDEIMIMTSEGKILRTKVVDLRDIGRNAQGVRLIGMEDTDRVVDVAKLAESSEDDGNDG
ncbi:MAG: DNA gyrase subunit A [Nitrospira sp.]|nr:DNA gyrase subunit A [Nitrospira sp.]